MIQIGLFAVAAVTFSAHLIQASPLLRQRDGAIQWLNNADFFSEFENTVSTLGSGSAAPPDNNYLTASDGSIWVVYTRNASFDPAFYVWQQNDTNTLNCLTNLHFTQDDDCVSVKGSECEAGAGTSKILNARTLSQLSSQNSKAIQVAISALVGATVNSGEDGVNLYRIDASHSTEYIRQGNQPEKDGGIDVVFGCGEQC